MVEITQYALYLSLRPVTVGSARAVGELLDLLGVPTVQVETYCSIKSITHYCFAIDELPLIPHKQTLSIQRKRLRFFFFEKNIFLFANYK